MKKQIIQIFHNMLEKEQKPDRLDTPEARQADRQDNGGAQGKMVRRDEPDRTDRTKTAVLEDAFEKVTDQKNFEKAVNGMLREGQESGCMLVSDLDRFKEVNEIYGRDTGDAVLRSVAGLFYDYFEECACIGRPVGDAFALWIPGLSGGDADYIRRQAGRVNDRLLHPVRDLPPVSVSVGVAFYENGDDCRSLGKRANRMLYKVKESGRCGCELDLMNNGSMVKTGHGGE